MQRSCEFAAARKASWAPRFAKPGSLEASWVAWEPATEPAELRGASQGASTAPRIWPAWESLGLPGPPWGGKPQTLNRLWE